MPNADQKAAIVSPHARDGGWEGFAHLAEANFDAESLHCPTRQVHPRGHHL
jgi:hypothetical protein